MVTVLLVDAPTADDRPMYAEFLRLHGLVPIELDSAEEALAGAAHADVVVTAIHVPGPSDGLRLVRRLRSDQRTARKPIIVLTASTLEADRRQAHEAGCDAFLMKPCLPELLVSEIHRALAMHGLSTLG